jgi:multidrug resistance efflux pump
VPENVLFSAIVESERRLLQKRLESFELKLQGYKRSQELFDSEVQSYERQIEVQTRLLSLVEKQLDAVKGIRDKGLVQQSIVLGLERDVSRSKSDLQSTQAYLSRARQDSQAAGQSADELRSVREQGIEEELASNAKELIVLDGRIRGAASVLGLLTQVNALGADVAPEPQYAIEILRGDADGKEAVFNATESTKVRPGDVIKIKAETGIAPEGEVKQP